MKRRLYTMMAMLFAVALTVAAVVSGAIAQTMGEYGATTAGVATSSGSFGTQTTYGPSDTGLSSGSGWAQYEQGDHQHLSDSDPFTQQGESSRWPQSRSGFGSDSSPAPGPGYNPTN